MTGAWQTVFMIAERRHGTKQGFESMSKHSISVMQAFYQIEAQEAMNAIMGGMWMSILGTE
jgi:hypothetical protein